jgi:Tfp pilus assembly protein PilN
MIEINLLPGAARKKTASSGPSIDYAAMFAGLSGQLKNVYLIGGAAVALIAVLAVGVMFLKASRDRSNAETRLDKAMTDSTRYADVLLARAQLEAKRDTLLRQVNLIRSIDDDRYIWPHVMDEISRALPAYTWITTLQYSGAAARPEESQAEAAPDDDREGKRRAPTHRPHRGHPGADAIHARPGAVAISVRGVGGARRTRHGSGKRDVRIHADDEVPAPGLDVGRHSPASSRRDGALTWPSSSRRSTRKARTPSPSPPSC